MMESRPAEVTSPRRSQTPQPKTRAPLGYRRLVVWRLARISILGALLGSVFPAWPGCHLSLEPWIERGEIRIGYREDALPFSYDEGLFPPPDAGGQAPIAPSVDAWRGVTGFSVRICKEIVSIINEQRSEIKDALARDCLDAEDAAKPDRCSHRAGLLNNEVGVKLIPVTPANRFTQLQTGNIDMLCGATSVTLERTKWVDFSLLTFLSSATFIYRSNLGLVTMNDLIGKRIGVLEGSSSSSILPEVLKGAKIAESQVTIVSSPSDDPLLHGEPISYVNVMDLLTRQRKGPDGKDVYPLDVFFADREIILVLLERHLQQHKTQNPSFLTVSNLSFSFEPYALAFNQGNRLLRYYANRTLVDLYNDNQIDTFINATFHHATQSPLLKSLYEIQRIPRQRGSDLCAPTDFGVSEEIDGRAPPVTN